MRINSVTLRIDNFDNAAMVEDRAGEVARLLRDVANRVEEMGVVNAMEGTRLRDSNGNVVGLCGCDWDTDDNNPPV